MDCYYFLPHKSEIQAKKQKHASNIHKYRVKLTINHTSNLELHILPNQTNIIKLEYDNFIEK